MVPEPVSEFQTLADPAAVLQADGPPPGFIAPLEPQEESSSSVTPALALPLPIGSLLKGRFKLQSVVARGGMSVIYRAVDEIRLRTRPTAADVAIKMVSEQPGLSEHLPSLIHREGMILQELTHPNLPRVFDTDCDGALHFMVMELLQGSTLSEILRRAPHRRLSFKASLMIVQEVANALGHTHKAGYIHCDVKPSNIFVTEQGDVKLLDFGVAQSSTHDETANGLGHFFRDVGAFTPNYTSYELLLGNAPCEGDDVFALAVVLYVMLTGQHPYGGKDAVDADAEGLSPLRSALIPSQRWHALRDALALRRSQRTSSIGDFVRHLSRPAFVKRFF